MTQTFDPEDFVLRRPPDLAPVDFKPCVSLIGVEVERLREARTRAIDSHAHVELILAEAWLGHLDELYVSAGRPLFRGNARIYIDRLTIDAVRRLHNFLTAGVSNWGPGVWRPRALHRAVAHLIRLRLQASGGGCEICHADVTLDIHHLNYRSFGYEIPADVMPLCRTCHLERHRIYGLPKDLSWQDGWQWPI